MQVQLTNAGAALLNANTGPITLTSGVLGSAFNYTPEPTDTNIHGTAVFTTVPTAPVAVNGNIVRYSLILDFSVGPFNFGEVGLFTSNGTLFALAASSSLISKLALTGSAGNSIRIDIYLSMVSQNYDMWLDVAESNNEFRCAILSSPDQLPPSQEATPNMYVISGQSQFQSAFIAYTDRQGLWNFDAYDFANQAEATITGFDNQSVTIALSQYNDNMNPSFLGEVILEFITGGLFGICRYVSSAVISGNSVTLGFANPVMQTPIVGDQVAVYARRALVTEQDFPIASSTVLGGIKVGTTLTIGGDGTLNINSGDISFPVTSVAGRTGAIVLTTADISGLATVATSGNYNDLTNKPAAYTLPVASLSVLGGVKAPSSGNITISGTGVIDIGFTPVTTVAGRTGNVVLTTADIGGLATVATTGSYNDLLNKPTIPSAYTLPIASSSVLGGIKVGTGLAINGSTGVLTASVTSVNGQTGAVVVQANDTSTSSGTTLITDNGSTTGIIKLRRIVAGTNITVATDGNNNLQISATATAPVTSVSGQTGVVVIQAQDNNASSGTTLITNGGSTTGVIKLKTIVAGSGIALSTDSNGNMQIAATSGGVTSVSGQTGVVVVQATDTSTLSGVSLITGSGTSTANIILRRLVAGSNVTLATDGNNNLLISAATAGVTSFNTRTGAVTLTSADISGVGGALLTDVAAAKYYDLQGGATGTMVSSQRVALHVAARTLNFAGNFANSQAACVTAPSATTTLTIYVGVTAVGVITFTTSSTTGTFTSTGGSPVTVTPGQVLTILANSSADATFADLAITLLGVAT